MASKKAIKRLIWKWQFNPWDILEDTPGFEGHYDELRAYRLEFLRLSDKAESLGVPSNLKLAAYVDALEKRISALEAKVLQPQ